MREVNLWTNRAGEFCCPNDMAAQGHENNDLLELYGVHEDDEN